MKYINKISESVNNQYNRYGEKNINKIYNKSLRYLMNDFFVFHTNEEIRKKTNKGVDFNEINHIILDISMYGGKDPLAQEYILIKEYYQKHLNMDVSKLKTPCIIALEASLILSNYNRYDGPRHSTHTLIKNIRKVITRYFLPNEEIMLYSSKGLKIDIGNITYPKLYDALASVNIDLNEFGGTFNDILYVLHVLENTIYKFDDLESDI